MKHKIRQELLQDLLMTNVYLDKEFKYITPEQIAYTYNNKDIKQFQIIINNKKVEELTNKLISIDINNPNFKTREDVKNVILELLITHEIGHIHNMHIFEKFTDTFNTIKKYCLKNKMNMDDLAILGDSHTIINIADDLQVNSDYLSQNLVDYSNKINLGLWISGACPFPKMTDYKIKYKETRNEYIQELINLVKSINEKNKGTNKQDIKNNIKEELKNKLKTETEKNESFNKDDNLDNIKDIIKESLNKDNKDIDKKIKEKQKENLKKDFNKLTKDKNNKNATEFIKDDEKTKNEEYGINSSNGKKSIKNILKNSNAFFNIDITKFLKTILTHYTQANYKKDMFRFERRGTNIPNLLKIGYKTDYKKNALRCLFILDVSGSMSLEKIKKAIINVKNELIKKFNKVDLVFYDTKELYKINVKELKDNINNIPEGGGTDMMNAIIENQDKYNTIIVYSDFETDYENINNIKCKNLYSIVDNSSIKYYVKKEPKLTDYLNLNKNVLILNK